ncbi:glyceraldehyde-3-phosphate dehydrogenase [Gordoniibacillus kamchatkensis]|uniref:Glyceraldehyde-3-phosphate dehydrogenase n=1 Tax=Gordoniibacillus kamchatkensis TaxID=1590651 RepID=A0ABR5AKP1_9BACL|nr:type I glyceraldehyde-3-phosphate dehydrogenase [Paenibacillus sp. VKM B-2647]KIL41358.1 glyceraldehyde-3-phosphate dehydrogenase [Paenibacillus sp. VKM B-2647]
MRIGLSGTGRIGRLFIRKALSAGKPGVELRAINSTTPAPTLAHLLKYDSVHGVWDANVQTEDGDLVVNGKRIPVVSERSPDLLPWEEYGVDLVIDATGKFCDRHGAEKHLFAGAKKVLVTAPGKNMDLTVVMGVNERKYDPLRHRLLSTASCTTNCIAPVLRILDDAFGVKQGWMTTVHAYTNDQNHLDNPHKDLRRARACTNSIIPTSTGVGKALADVLPHLAPVIQGISVRVPTQDVSLLDLQVQLGQTVDVTDVRKAFQQAVAGTIGTYVGYNELPLVSADYVGNEKSAIVDGLSVLARGDQVKLLAWYDNEWAYASRVYDFAAYAARAELSGKGEKAQCLTHLA